MAHDWDLPSPPERVKVSLGLVGHGTQSMSARATQTPRSRQQERSDLNDALSRLAAPDKDAQHTPKIVRERALATLRGEERSRIRRPLEHIPKDSAHVLAGDRAHVGEHHEAGRLAAAPQDYAWEHRYIASRALAQLGPDAAPHAHMLARARCDRSHGVRHAADHALQCLGPDGVKCLADGLRDPAPRARERAVLALGAVGPSASPHAEALMDALQDDSRRVRLAAAEVLERLGPMAPPGADDAIKRWENHRARRSRIDRASLEVWDRHLSRCPGEDSSHARIDGQHLGSCPKPYGRCRCRRAGPWRQAECVFKRPYDGLEGQTQL